MHESLFVTGTCWGGNQKTNTAMPPTETRTPYEVMLAYLTGGHYVSPDNSCAYNEGMQGDSPSTPVTQRASKNISAVASRGIPYPRVGSDLPVTAWIVSAK